MLYQTPGAEDKVFLKSGKIILYTDGYDDGFVSVPSLVGLTIDEAARIAVNSGLNLSLLGSGGGVVVSQSLPLGAPRC